MQKEITAVIFSFFAISIFLVGLVAKPKYGIYLIIFLMPLAGNSITVRYFNVSFVSILIMAFSIAYLIRKKITYSTIEKIKYKKYIILILSLYCISLLSLVFKGVGLDITYFGLIEENVTNYISTALAAIMFYLIISIEIHSLDQVFDYMKVFLSTLFFLAVVVFAKKILHFPLPGFISPTYSIGIPGTVTQIIAHDVDSSGISNFAGFLGYVENFGEYLFVLFAISIILMFKSKGNMKQRNIGMAGVILTLVFSVPTAIRALPIMIALFMVLCLLFAENIRKRYFIICLLLGGLVLFVCIQDYLRGTYFFQRFYEFERRYIESRGRGTLEDFAYLIGRGELMTILPDVIETGSLLGVGPFVVWQLNGSNIPFHNLYYALYLNFGLIGVSIFIIFFSRIVIDLYKIYRNSVKLKDTAMLFLFMFLILLSEQIKVSSYRIAFGILMFWFLFGLFASLQNVEASRRPASRQKLQVISRL